MIINSISSINFQSNLRKRYGAKSPKSELDYMMPAVRDEADKFLSTRFDYQKVLLEIKGKLSTEDNLRENVRSAIQDIDESLKELKNFDEAENILLCLLQSDDKDDKEKSICLFNVLYDKTNLSEAVYLNMSKALKNVKMPSQNAVLAKTRIISHYKTMENIQYRLFFQETYEDDENNYKKIIDFGEF